ncbi:zinc finger CCCH domain-containing protein 37 isoform X2 [Beta vulgaris subsp. vulgaris]|uniref:zinc finger CCCH domain-containing protein 37 isoform X2 n=1 Tax=Beta vulgaris subsp. vulgaris TaxID=3555 RepID=UPI0020366C6C|nr:zinc finger CCCH domain-containing protein 37 isoform X2 [Beta vulgaris subsp. vulgaris]
MANQLYNGHQNSLSNIYNPSTRSAINTTYPAEPPSLLSSSRYLSSFPDPHSLSSDSPSESVRRSLSYSDTHGLTAASRSIVPTATSTSLWPSFDVFSAYRKRPSEALYNHSVLGAHMVGQNEAWFSSDSLAKRPRFQSASNLPVYPQRPGEKDCTHYMLTRTCKFGDNCKFDHPIWVPAGGIPDWKEPPAVPSEIYPERPGEPDCPYFLKTQKCKFGLKCKFNHPKDKLILAQDTSAETDASDLPERPTEPLCSFYTKTGKCKFGAACKFHHPKDIQVPSDGQEADDEEQTHSIDHLGTTSDGNSLKALTSNPASSYNSKGLPVRMGEVDCPFYLKTGSCKYGANCRYNHPDRNELSSPFSVINPSSAVVGHAVLPALASVSAGLINPAASIFQSLQPGLPQTTFGQVPVIYPQRPGQIECDGVQHCPFYMKTGTCSYAVNCKFDHPPPGEVMAAAGKETLTKAEEEGKESEEGAATAEK